VKKNIRFSEEQSSCDDSHSASQILRRLWNPKILYRVHKSPPPVPILSQMNPVHTFTPSFPQSHFNIILPFTPSSSECCFPFKLPNQIFYVFRISPLSYMPLSFILPDLIILIIFGEECKLCGWLLIMHFSPARCHIISHF
jgi:hypothetical protein